MTGRLIDVVQTVDRKFRVTFEVDAIDEIRGMENKEISLTITKTAKKRSLNANAYFHVLVGKIADKMAISKPKCKNMLLGRYGQRWIEEDAPLIISVLSKIDMEEREDIHCIPVGHGRVGNKDFTHWAVIRPSHEYDTAEMNALITGTVDEAKALDIETIPPAELERMMKSWNQSYKKNENAQSAKQQSDWSAIM